MNDGAVLTEPSTRAQTARALDMKLEVIVVPVSR